MTSRTNTFQNLFVDDDYKIEDREKEIKKAKKKLNEIEKLKQKSSLTDEEQSKLSREQYYRDIVDPKPIIYKPSIKEQEIAAKKKLKKEAEKARVEADKLKKEAEKARLEEEKKQTKAEKARLEAERKRKEAEREAEREAKREKESKKKEQEREAKREKESKKKEEEKIHMLKSLNNNDLAKEWQTTLIKNEYNVNKTFRLMSLKYHPDKNLEKILWAHEKQRELNTLKENTLKIYKF
jgi:colicin import membrane protein